MQFTNLVQSTFAVRLFLQPIPIRTYTHACLSGCLHIGAHGSRELYALSRKTIFTQLSFPVCDSRMQTISDGKKFGTFEAIGANHGIVVEHDKQRKFCNNVTFAEEVVPRHDSRCKLQSYPLIINASLTAVRMQGSTCCAGSASRSASLVHEHYVFSGQRHFASTIFADQILIVGWRLSKEAWPLVGSVSATRCTNALVFFFFFFFFFFYYYFFL